MAVCHQAAPHQAALTHQKGIGGQDRKSHGQRMSIALRRSLQTMPWVTPGAHDGGEGCP